MKTLRSFCVVPFAVLIFAWFGGIKPSLAQDISLEFTLISTEGKIVDITNAGDGSGRLFLVQQNGRIFIHRDGADLPTPFLDITDRVRVGGERGLLSLAFAPDYASSGYFYTWYTDQDSNMRISRFKVSANPDIADPASEQLVLEVEQPANNHNGGRLQFGPDGMLYLGIGDGGGANDPDNNGQTMTTLLGKLIRIDVDPAHGTYAIPDDNPFAHTDFELDEIWASGLRNPWRMSFDSQTGDLYIADVGQGSREEVNFQPASSPGGENYGWNVMEGDLCFFGQCDPELYDLPVFVYNHGRGCSITGGEVYRGFAYPDLHGVYLAGDYCSGIIWGIKQVNGEWQEQQLINTDYSILTFGLGEDGSMYLAADGRGVYLVSDGEVVAEPDFAINAGMNDSWFDSATNGQGFFIVVYPEQGLVFLSWFTYDTERPPDDVVAILGEAGHRWLTALGPYEGNVATLELFSSEGGVFDSPDPPVAPAEQIGTMTVTWSSCGAAVLEYDIPELNLSGSIPLQRIVSDNASVCEALQ